MTVATPTTVIGGVNVIDAELAESLQQSLADVERRFAEELGDRDERVVAATTYLAKAGGKRFRPLFALLAAQFGPRPQDESVLLAATMIELAHLATLYHDDVMDEATARRGSAAANMVWGNKIAILAGDYLIGHALRIAATLGSRAMHVIATTFAELVTGQMQETLGTDDPAGVEAHYLRTIECKTGSLIAASGHLGAQLAGAQEVHVDRIESFGMRLGTMFQIVDDIIDVSSAFEHSGKTPGADLREGVITLPILYATYDEGPAGRRLRELLTGPIRDERLMEEALFLIHDAHGVELARQKLAGLACLAQADLSSLPSVPARAAFANLIDHTVTRAA
ncbi:polyprenyl synthetase family protein [Mycobacterium sp. CBMA271]|uniref:polyprenyl synthetase family protein n=1 Tax=unclassified Mycobacteroides TaxID=2618759 RepID=UPI0012DD431E|nr:MULTISPECIES: polyprenyl synthetase family protein [unclassified Mycobacteroides]MUM16576.1 geranylgeranyl pyrophosphate synthase [Mycobacteroides sp. CBMA 326]MUM22117.1 polyprenyl synthetase family protein [Mycobacteroides sp. CBMA 271]